MRLNKYQANFLAEPRQLLGFTHVIRLALGGQAKSEHGYRIELITYHSY